MTLSFDFLFIVYVVWGVMFLACAVWFKFFFQKALGHRIGEALRANDRKPLLGLYVTRGLIQDIVSESDLRLLKKRRNIGLAIFLVFVAAQLSIYFLIDQSLTRLD